MKAADGFAVTEAWANKQVQFFYCNWAAVGDAVFGYPADGGKKFTALSLADGAVRWQDANLTDANVLAGDRELLTLRGDGRLSRATPTADGLDATAAIPLFAGRSWTAPTVVGDRPYARNASEIVCLRLAPAR